jgi:hypothetical protein
VVMSAGPSFKLRNQMSISVLVSTGRQGKS